MRGARVAGTLLPLAAVALALTACGTAAEDARTTERVADLERQVSEVEQSAASASAAAAAPDVQGAGSETLPGYFDNSSPAAALESLYQLVAHEEYGLACQMLDVELQLEVMGGVGDTCTTFLDQHYDQELRDGLLADDGVTVDADSIVVSGDLAALADRGLVDPIPADDPVLSVAGLASYDGTWTITYLPDEG